jgi:ubiquitin carboxyl-terminal hydrolase 4/11/15
MTQVGENGVTSAQYEELPVLLLPPSTTETAADAMEVESNAADDKSFAAVATPARRKRYASGLGNLGNTCFMNSTLQCLAHTEPLRRYFLSGDYEDELNRDNPLGTGGELATQFAYLMSEMWGLPAKRRNVMGTDFSYSNSTSAVYPRSFKYTLGKHAEQFMGYDQHDSQEFATYLLDALHEDTNRVTQKPYVEKPEQGEDEPDELAASKAWDLHLRREDSKVLENFMGQVKSRVRCCEEGCNRVSTTFDPFMYLSVPIPGATDRRMKVTFISLDPTENTKNLTLTVNKTASMGTMMGKLNEELVKLGIRNEPIPLHDLCAVDVWSYEVYSWYTHESEIDRIRESDNTYVYELRSLTEIQELAQKEDADEDDDPDSFDNKTKYRPHRYKLDLETMTMLNKDDGWTTILERFVQQSTLLLSMLNPKRGTCDERIKFHQRLENFIDLCHKETAEEESTGLKRAREETDSDSKSETAVSPTEEAMQALLDRSDASITFKDVKTRHDVAILEFCSNKLRQFILKMIKEKKKKYKDGIQIQVIMRRPSATNGGNFSTKDHTFAPPLIMRVPSSLTVHGLRETLSLRLARSLKSADKPSAEVMDEVPALESQPFGSPALLTMRQIPLSYETKGTYTYKANSGGTKKLGMLERAGQAEEGTRPVLMTVPTDEAEHELVSDIVGPLGSVNLDWPAELNDRCFDLSEYEAADDVKSLEDVDDGTAQKTTSVSDCIEKYCQMEQLEETEMWYCNKCKKHVRAWKQFHLYRAPPILIVHLKRFQYSATTHRRDKIGAFIDFPLEGLDLTPLVSHWVEDEKPIYDCYAVSNHYGGLGGGHYTAYTLSDDGTWCYYDDSRITNDVPVKEVVSEAAYVLYYRRRDVPVGQDFIAEAPTPAIVQDQLETASDISSNNTAQAGDDDMVVESADAGSAASSRTCPSMDGGDDLYGNSNNFETGSDDKMASASGDDFPLQ